MSKVHPLVSLLDVDDTLFDNDALERELREHLSRSWKASGRDRFWEIFEQLPAIEQRYPTSTTSWWVTSRRLDRRPLYSSSTGGVAAAVVVGVGRQQHKSAIVL